MYLSSPSLSGFLARVKQAWPLHNFQNHSSNIERQLVIYSWALHIFQTKGGKGLLVLLQPIISFPSAWETEVLAQAIQVDLAVASVARSQIAGDTQKL